MIAADGWRKNSIWEHSQRVRELYQRRVERREPEMICAAQAAQLLAPFVSAGDSLLDAGCGSGYFWHSLKKRNIPVEYFGIDATASFIAMGRVTLPTYGLPADHLQVVRIEDLNAEVDHGICMNVLSNLDNYHRPLERLLLSARKTVILRESCAAQAHYNFVVDQYLDPGVTLKVHVNTYPIDEVMAFIASYGFRVEQHVDEFTGGHLQSVIGYPHHWTFLVASRA